MPVEEDLHEVHLAEKVDNVQGLAEDILEGVRIVSPQVFEQIVCLNFDAYLL